ncbi:DNA polymerase alpha/epsilon subunit B-domain-containing protein [Pilaira anomala]|nr:DNA polymerase alpha/epsilon subunit B-domain-containing protein [Pilaira anomala]
MMQSSAAIAATLTPFQRADEDINESLQDMTIDEAHIESVDVTQHFHVVDAFSMPKLVYDEHTRTFNKSKQSSKLLAGAREKGEMFRERLLLVRQRLLRNENFCPPTMRMTDSANFIRITPVKALIGHDGEDFILFGMLTQVEEKKVFLEDEDAHIELVLDNAQYNYGLFTDGSFVLVEGTYGDDHRFHVVEVNLPPAESRDMTDALFSHVNFLGLQKPLIDEKLLKIEETTNNDITFVIISDLHLDQPKVMKALRIILDGYSNAQVPLAFIFIGNFSSKPFRYSASQTSEYKDNFSALADLIGEFHNLATHSNFVFVPGPKDPWGGNTLPQREIPPSFIGRMQQKVRKFTFTTNPCRIRYCTQELVIFREDMLSKIWRNTLLTPNLEIDDDPIRHLVHTIVDQGHLSPLPLSVKPIYWSYDSALRLYPLPQTLIMADKCENYGITYEGTHCINPGSFPNSDFEWSIYYPNTRLSEKCSLPYAI